MKLIDQRPHKELHKRIYDCECKPWRRGVNYCENCQKAVIDFMNKYGVGVLCRDEEVEILLKGNMRLIKDNEILKTKLEKKIKRVEELKRETEEVKGK